ncbi:uncharacterized protein B0H18DRAFT_1027318 [Fomitopsis serialis]|uniref:uncharacterized protein n=1 Tax=Fomitopsis serialis TaxID=139415 RepID=UPI002007791D|nr:uncharacterized protein B0H18DRAFT_1027318 [Neoantrodia serialis]KAH9919641.1 hypothetical protein B0H18DRAFT_1027318 [Neoantrodia serialis]
MANSTSIEELYLLHWALQGVLAVQVFFYHTNFPKDPLRLKLIVYGIFIFEWITFGLITADAFVTFVHNANKGVDKYYAIGNQWFVCFFAWRIYVLSRFLLCVIQIMSGILREAHTIDGVLSTKSGVITIILLGATTLLVDVITALSMTILLLRQKMVLRRTTVMINRIVLLTIETGALTASVAILGGILALTFPKGTYYIPAVYNQSKLYAITLLAHLLNRIHLRRIPSLDGTATQDVEPSPEQVKTVKPAATETFMT